jgi:hypothetical protein
MYKKEVKADGTTTDGIPSKTKVSGILPKELLHLLYIFIGCVLTWLVIAFVMFLAKYFGWRK